MDIEKFTELVFQDHEFNCPLGPSRADRLLELLDLEPEARVLEVCCGNGELLVRLMEQFQVRAVGIDPHPGFLQATWNRAAERAPLSDLDLHQIDPAAYSLGPEEAEPFDVAFCLDTPRAYNGLAQALKALPPLVRPGGMLWVGGPYRKGPAGPSTDPGPLSHAENAALGLAEGLRLLFAFVSSEDERDEYAALSWRSLERYAAGQPDDPDIPEMLGRIHRSRDTYLQQERDTQGYGFYLFQTP